MIEMSDVRQFVVDTFLFGNTGTLNDQTSFIGEGVIDSVGMLELISFLEARYRIVIADHEVIRDNLDSFARIRRFLETKLAARTVTSAPAAVSAGV